MRIKIWLAAMLAILSTVNMASAQGLAYSIYTSVNGTSNPGSGAYTASQGSTVNVSIYLQETITGGATSLINTVGVYGVALGINAQAGGTGTITTASGSATALPGASTGAILNTIQVNNTSAGNSAALAWTSGFTATIGNGLPTTSSYPSTTASGNILLGTLAITVGSASTTYTMGSGYAGSSANTNGAPSFLLTDFSDLAYGASNNGSDPTYTGAFDGTPYSFSVAPSSSGVPEPSSLLLCGFALSGLGYRAWRRRKGEKKTETEPALDTAV